jgi:hypothetical protein
MARQSTAVIVCLVVLSASGRTAEASDFFSYKKGREVFPCGALPAELAARPELKEAQAGDLCRVFGVLGAYLHRWDCRPVAFRDLTVWDHPSVVRAAARRCQQTPATLPFWPQHGRLVLATALLLLITFGVWARVRKSGTREAGKSDDS